MAKKIITGIFPKEKIKEGSEIQVDNVDFNIKIANTTGNEKQMIVTCQSETYGETTGVYDLKTGKLELWVPKETKLVKTPKQQKATATV